MAEPTSMAARPVVDETHSSPVCHWCKLPVEIRLMILGFAEGEGRTIKVKVREHWNIENHMRFMQEKEPRPFPEHPFSHMLVCKQYLEEFAQIYMAQNVFKVDRLYDLEHIRSPRKPVQSYLNQSIRHLEAEHISHTDISLLKKGIELLRALPMLQRLTLNFDKYAFLSNHSNDKIFDHQWTDAEISGTDSVAACLKFRNLTSIEIHAKTPLWMSSINPTTAAKRTANFTQLSHRTEALLHDVTTQRCQAAKNHAQSKSIKSIHEAFGLHQKEQEEKERTQRKLERMRRKGEWARVNEALRLPQVTFPAARLTDDNIPKTEAKLVQLMYTRKHDVLEWMKNAVQEKAALAALKEENEALKRLSE